MFKVFMTELYNFVNSYVIGLNTGEKMDFKSDPTWKERERERTIAKEKEREGGRGRGRTKAREEKKKSERERNTQKTRE